MLAKLSKNSCNSCTKCGLLGLRLILGIILIVHGFPKLFGDTAGLLAFFESTVLPAPNLLLILAGVIELVGGVAIVLGYKTRYFSWLVVFEFTVIILFVKLAKGFSAMELDLLILANAYALSAMGSGKYSLERLLSKRKEKIDGKKYVLCQ